MSSASIGIDPDAKEVMHCLYVTMPQMYMTPLLLTRYWG